MSPDVHALTGAYVLDAVSDLERAAFERHIVECDACAQEVRELRETAARLGQAAEVEPPPYLKPRMMATMRQVRQLPRDVQPRTGSGRSAASRWALRLSTAAAAVLLVATGVLGVLLVRERNALNDTRQYADSLSSILQSGDARIATGQGPTGGSATVVVSRSQGQGLVLASEMPALPESQVYQAWYIGPGDAFRSAGLLPRSDTVQLDLDGIGSATSFGITVEPAGGSPRPGPQPIIQLDFPA